MVFVRPFALFDMIFVFSWLISMPYAVDAVSTVLTRFSSSSSLPASPSISSVKRKFVNYSATASNCAVMIFKRICHDLLKEDSVGDSKLPCLTPTVVRNQSPVFPWKSTALVAFSYRLLMMVMRLAPMLYLCMVVQSAAHHILSKAFLKSIKTWYRSCWCCWYFSISTLKLKICSVVLLPIRKPACSSTMISSACGLSLFSRIFNMNLLGWLMRLIVR